jgi:hypothetical protein
MNFHSNEKQLQKLLFIGKREATGKSKTKKRCHNPGSYIISQKEYDPFVKVGTSYGSGGLYDRIKHYKLCYNKKCDFFVNYLVISPRIKLVGSSISYAQIMEKLLISGIDAKAKESYSDEVMMIIDANKLYNDIKKILDNNRAYWSHFVVFDGSRWKVYHYDESLNTSKQFTNDTEIINGKVPANHMISSYNYIDKKDVVDIPPLGVINKDKVFKIKTPKPIIYKNMPKKLSKNQTANILMKILKGQ